MKINVNFDRQILYSEQLASELLRYGASLTGPNPYALDEAFGILAEQHPRYASLLRLFRIQHLCNYACDALKPALCNMLESAAVSRAPYLNHLAASLSKLSRIEFARLLQSWLWSIYTFSGHSPHLYATLFNTFEQLLQYHKLVLPLQSTNLHRARMSGIGYGLVLFQFVRQLLSAAPAVGFYFIERPVVRILLLAIPPVSANAIFTRIYRTNLRFRNYLFITRPMLVPPRPYPPFSCEFNASTVIPGGLLGNGLYFHVLLYRPVSSSSHRLWLQPEVLRGLNNVQHIPYYIDNELLILFQHHFSLLPGFLEARTRRHYITRLVILRRRIHALFVDRDNLERSSQLQYCHRRRAWLQHRLAKHNKLLRTFAAFQRAAHLDRFYFPLQLDFRMRLYPLAGYGELHPLHSKPARALIRFEYGVPFELCAFAQYTARCYRRTLSPSESDLLTQFEQLRPVIVQFRCPAVFRRLLREAERPFQFIACCLEYERFSKARDAGLTYYTRLPIYLDATASGLQLLSLYLGLDGLAVKLNLYSDPGLEPGTGPFVHDVYTYLLRQFLGVGDWSESFLLSLRRVFKPLIVAFCYGLTRQRFVSQALAELRRPSLLQLLYRSFSSAGHQRVDDVFLNSFVTAFWAYLSALPLFEVAHDLFGLVNPRISHFSWSTPLNRIAPCYRRTHLLQIKHKSKLLGTKTALYPLPLDRFNLRQSRALLPNFIQSLEAYVMFRVIISSSFPLLGLHDGWGVPMNCAFLLTRSVRTAYIEIARFDDTAFSFTSCPNLRCGLPRLSVFRISHARFPVFF